MKIIKQACGAYETNCYIVFAENGEFIIDPGVNALEFVKKNVKNPLAILNTHGHFDHIWDNASIKNEFKIPLYIHKNDAFMLNDPFNQGFEPSRADVLVDDDENLDICGTKFKFHFFPGHTPGCCTIELVGQAVMFSGDFLFKQSIGRWDFPYSDANLMQKSLEKVMAYKDDFRLLPGHFDESTLKEEQIHLPAWLRYLKG